MSAIFYIMGKSATGKDLVYRTIKQDYPELTPIVLYTTRPMRKKETQGVEYHFIDEAKLEEFDKAGKIIEKRTYQTVHGPWHYATVDDGTVDPADPDKFYVAIGTLEAYTRMRGYYGAEMMIPIYLYSDDVTRLERAIRREKKQEKPNYKEVCRRFLADEEDFSEENLRNAGIFVPADSPQSKEPDGNGVHTPQTGEGEKLTPGFKKESMEEAYPLICRPIDRITGRQPQEAD